MGRGAQNASEMQMQEETDPFSQASFLHIAADESLLYFYVSIVLFWAGGPNWTKNTVCICVSLFHSFRFINAFTFRKSVFFCGLK